ncbi:membrane protein [Microbacterium phage Badulia]|nr:membrane protein [Microbacterium phage Badulia]
MIGEAIASTVMGVTVGSAVGDILGAVPMRESSPTVPATTGDARPRQTASGKVVSGGPSPKESLWLSAAIVLGAMLVLVFGDRVLKEARIA